MEQLQVDICVIGGGSGGLSVSAVASSLGASVVLFEHHKMGGDCLNYGCVPSKALLAAGKAAAAMRKADQFGIEAALGNASFPNVNAHVQGVIASIAPHDSVERFTGLGVRVIEEGAQFVSRDTVRSASGSVEVKARKFVISTGSRPMVPPIAGLDTVKYFTNETIFDNTEVLPHLIVVGGGPIGLEMAQAHRRLGCEVTVLEGLQPLAKDDPELTAIALQALQDEGITIHSQSKVTLVEPADGGVRVHYQPSGDTAPSSVQGSHLLMAVGRRANVENLGLEAAGIELKRTGIKVDGSMRTTNRRVYAIGDVAGNLQFTHVAGYHAGLFIRKSLFAMPAKERTSHIPWVTYLDPEIANVGLTEAAAKQKYGDGVRALRFNFNEIDRARAERKTAGMIKVITLANGTVVGAGIVGANAGDLLMPWCLMVTHRMNIKKMQAVVAPYPSMGDLAVRVSYEFSRHLAGSPGVRRLVNWMKRL